MTTPRQHLWYAIAMLLFRRGIDLSSDFACSLAPAAGERARERGTINHGPSFVVDISGFRLTFDSFLKRLPPLPRDGGEGTGEQPQLMLRRDQCSRGIGIRTACRLAMLFCAMLIIGCDKSPGKPDPARRPIAPHEVADFDSLFQRNCAGCHGRDGQLGPAPPVNDPLFLAIVPDAELVRILRDGRAGTLMPAFAERQGGTLTDDQIQILAGGLKPKWQDHSVDAATLPPYAGSDGDAERGAILFANACAECHGDDGRGGDAGAINEVAFLSLISDQAIRRIIITGRPDLGMPDYASHAGLDAKTPQHASSQIDDLVALLASWRKTGNHHINATHSAHNHDD